METKTLTSAIALTFLITGSSAIAMNQDPRDTNPSSVSKKSPELTQVADPKNTTSSSTPTPSPDNKSEQPTPAPAKKGWFEGWFWGSKEEKKEDTSKSATSQVSQTELDVTNQAKLHSSTPKMCEGYGFELTLTNDLTNRKVYTAVVPNEPFPQKATYQFENPVKLGNVKITWYSENDFGTDYTLDFLNNENKLLKQISVTDKKGAVHDIDFPSIESTQFVTLTVNKVNGEQRTLINQIKFFQK